MVSSWIKFSSQCKSRLSAIARSCYLRRVHWFEKYREAKEVQAELQEAVRNGEARCRQLEEEKEALCGRISELETQLAEPCPVALPLGDVPRGQQYGANMIALCVNLARKLGVRRAVRALKIF